MINKNQLKLEDNDLEWTRSHLSAAFVIYYYLLRTLYTQFCFFLVNYLHVIMYCDNWV